MFRKLKRKFLLTATVSMLLLMVTILAVMNTINYYSIVRDSDSILDMLSQAKTNFPEGQFPSDISDAFTQKDDFSLPRGMSPEVPYESRYFIAMVNNEGEIIRSDLTNIITIDTASLEEYAATAFRSDRERAFIGEFRYLKTDDGKLTCILFLDCGRKLDSFRDFLLISSSVGIGSCVILFVLLLFVIGKIVRPISESYEKQKRFITDAGHEIKTPLTIINANLDILSEDLGEQEELSDIRQQTQRLTDLTNDLVYLSRMEETENAVVKTEFPVSDIINDTVASFAPLAQAQEKSLSAQVESAVALHGSPNAIRQLVSILLENAIKYTPRNGFVALTMCVQKKSWILSLYNSTAEKMTQGELSHIFDRFYRTDASRNSETGGHGIGLSIAKAIVESHSGTISAYTKGGYDFCITVRLPL